MNCAFKIVFELDSDKRCRSKLKYLKIFLAARSSIHNYTFNYSISVLKKESIKLDLPFIYY